MSLAILVVGCQLVLQPTPLPGWRSPVSELFVDVSAFPKGWQVEFPEDTVTDPAVNHVYRSWWHEGVSGIYDQQIWRAYTITVADRKYDELRQSQFHPNEPLYPGTIFIGFEPPAEIDFQSQVADEFYLACGWLRWAYCQVVARYRNYVVLMRLSREAEFEGNKSDGLTFEEIEAVVRAMDSKFGEVLTSLPTPPPP
jgi:hypothetical protein